MSAISAARSSCAPNLAGGSKVDFNGLNFVAYAMDGVDWIHWTKVKNAATPSANVTNLSVSQLEAIYTDSLTCPGPGGTTLTNNWFCLNGGTGTPSNKGIALDMAQNGSGTEATWVSTLNIPSTDTFPFGGENSRHVIFENENAVDPGQRRRGQRGASSSSRSATTSRAAPRTRACAPAVRPRPLRSAR